MGAIPPVSQINAGYGAAPLGDNAALSISVEPYGGHFVVQNNRSFVRLETNYQYFIS